MSPLTSCSAFSPSDHIRGVFAFPGWGTGFVPAEPQAGRCPCTAASTGRVCRVCFTSLRDQPHLEQCPFQRVPFPASPSCFLGSPETAWMLENNEHMDKNQRLCQRMKGDFCGVPQFLWVLCLALIPAAVQHFPLPTLPAAPSTEAPSLPTPKNKISVWCLWDVAPVLIV